MTTLRALVVDDEPLLRDELVRMLSATGRVDVVGTGGNGLEALALVERQRPDVLFLDIEMPELNGLEVVSSIDPAHTPAIVFVTAYGRYATNAFDIDAVDYLLKPFDAPRLQRCLDRLASRAEPAPAPHETTRSSYLTRVAVRIGARVQIVPLRDVRWIGAADNYVELHCASGVHLYRRTMRDLESLLDPADFARIHRSAIVRLDCVKDLKPVRAGDWEIRTVQGERLRLSRSYREAFTARLGRVG